MCPGLQILEVFFLYSCHHPVILQVLSHLYVVWIGLEEGVGSCHRLVQLVDLKTETGGQLIFYKLNDFILFKCAVQVKTLF